MQSGTLTVEAGKQFKDYVPAPQSGHAMYQIDLARFAGPLDLLLFLIKRHEIDILDIPIAFICGRYLACVEGMQNLSMDVAAEFMAVAAELLHIKSKVLLPDLTSDSETEEDDEDPRAALVQRLLEYQKFQQAAQGLDVLERLGRDVFAHPAQRSAPEVEEAPRRLRPASVFTLLQAFHTILKRHKPVERHKVVVETVSVQKRMHSLIGRLTARATLSLTDLFADLADRLDVIVSFLAVLELTRMKLLRLVESEEGTLMLQSRFNDAEEAYDKLQGAEPDFK